MNSPRTRLPCFIRPHDNIFAVYKVGNRGAYLVIASWRTDPNLAFWGLPCVRVRVHIIARGAGAIVVRYQSTVGSNYIFRRHAHRLGRAQSGCPAACVGACRAIVAAVGPGLILKFTSRTRSALSDPSRVVRLCVTRITSDALVWRHRQAVHKAIALVTRGQCARASRRTSCAVLISS